MDKKLSREFYLNPDTVAASRALLGKLLVVPDVQGRLVSGMIVETEAYLGTTDRASHSFGGRRTPRNEITYGTGGHAYVYFIYGMYYQLNVVTGPDGQPHAVLIRAVEPVEGIEIMRERRGFLSEPGAIATGSSVVKKKSRADKNLTSGPGKLCIALNITRELNSADLLGDRIWLEDHRSFTDAEIAVGPRIGIDYAGEDAEKPWRFWVKNNTFTSRR